MSCLTFLIYQYLLKLLEFDVQTIGGKSISSECPFQSHISFVAFKLHFIAVGKFIGLEYVNSVLSLQSLLQSLFYSYVYFAELRYSHF